MIERVRIINYLNQSITLYMTRPDINGFIIKNIEGLGPAHGNISISDLATGDGGVFNSSRKQTRNIVLTLGFDDDCGESIETIRNKTYKYFPVGKVLTIQVFTDERERRTIGYVESNEPNIFSDSEGCQISIICPKSDFMDIEQHVIENTSKTRINPLFSFPFSNPGIYEPAICFGDISSLEHVDVIYSGDVPIGFEISIIFNHDIFDDTTDPNHTLFADSIVIEQRHSDDIPPFSLYNPTLILDLDKMTEKGVYPRNGDIITISSVFGYKSISINGTSILNCVDKERSYDNWFKLYKGINKFYISIDRLHTENDVEVLTFDKSKNDKILDVRIYYDNNYEGV